MKRRCTLGLCLLFIALQPAKSQTEPVPGIGDRTPDGFLVKCYWVGTFEQVEKFEGQGVTDLFGQALSPVCGKSTTTASIIITEEIDNSGQLRAVVRAGNWQSNFTGLHYSFKNGRRVGAGPGGSGGGRIPTSGEGAPTVSITQGQNTAGISLGWTETEPLAFDSKYLPLKLVMGGPNPLGIGPSGTHRPHLEVDTKEKTERRHAHVMGMTAIEEPVRAGRTVIRQEWGDRGSDWYARWIMTRVCQYGKLKLITPRGDPRTAPRALDPCLQGAHPGTLDGQNEFTFDCASPGKLVINFKASVTPAEGINAVRDRVSFSIGAVGESSLEWDQSNPNGKATISGNFLVAKATLTGLPAKNDDFGKKRVQLLLDGAAVEETQIEVFFPLYAENHPGGQADSPNWFHYYLQTVPRLGPKPNLKYSTTHSSHFDPDADEICIDDGCIKTYLPPYGAFGALLGIDTFAWCTIHEMQHYKDWVDFWDVDNQRRAKHAAALGKRGRDGELDNDRIPNRREDVDFNGNYNRGDLYDWQNPKTPTAGRPANIINDFEDWNCKRHKTAKGNHAKDWGDPGMQHLTLDKWID